MVNKFTLLPLLGLLVLFSSSIPGVQAEERPPENSSSYTYCRYPGTKASPAKEKSWIQSLQDILFPWWTTQNDPPQPAGQSIDTNAAHLTARTRLPSEPLIPTETGTELKLRIGELADQIMANGNDSWTGNDSTMVITTFVDLNQLYNTTDLGRLLAELMIGELQKSGIRTIDVRLANSLLIKEGYGEYGLSREMSELSYVHEARTRLVGTYSVADNQVVINARVLHQEDGRVLSSGTIILEKNRMLTKLLRDSGWPASTPQAVMIESFDSINSSR